jgi:hypothetical protein
MCCRDCPVEPFRVGSALCTPRQAVWALGNIAGDSHLCRDMVLKEGALPALIRQLGEPRKITMLRNATWTLSNFCRGKPSPPFELVQDALGILSHLIFHQVRVCECSYACVSSGCLCGRGTCVVQLVGAVCVVGGPVWCSWWGLGRCVVSPLHVGWLGRVRCVLVGLRAVVGWQQSLAWWVCGCAGVCLCAC